MTDKTTRKARNTEPIITVNTVFVGKQSDRDAFIDLIAQKHLSAGKEQRDCSDREKNTADITSTV